MVNTYITPFEYKRAASGGASQEVASLTGNLLRLSSGVIVGATSLPVTPNTTVNLAVDDPIWIFDGLNSEMVTVTATTASNANAIPVTALAFAHNIKTVICSDGTNGSLGETLFSASAEVDGITQQASLLQATYVETYNLRTMDANINSDGQLTIRTRQFPVTAISALSIETSVNAITTLDPAQAVIASQQKLIGVPVIAQIGAGPSQLILQPPLNQQSAGMINLTYTAGFAMLPWEYKQATILLTSNLLSDRLNPTGAADYQSGAVKTTVYLRGDLSGETSLVKRARKLLEPVTRER